MSDFPKELSELRKEVVESRNQSIKTDNQIKNLALDIKGFEQRFDLLDKKARYSSFGVYLIIAATVAVAGYLISRFPSRRLKRHPPKPSMKLRALSKSSRSKRRSSKVSASNSLMKRRLARALGRVRWRSSKR